MLNLSIIQPGRYLGQGSYGINAAAIGMPLEAHFEVEAFPNALIIEGKWQQHSGRPTFAFRIELRRDELSQSQAEVSVTASGVGALLGRMSMRGPTLELLASDQSNGHLLSARIVPLEKPQIYEFSGIIGVGGKQWFPFHLHVVPTEGRSAVSNVVHMLGGQKSGAI